MTLKEINIEVFVIIFSLRILLYFLHCGSYSYYIGTLRLFKNVLYLYRRLTHFFKLMVQLLCLPSLICVFICESFIIFNSYRLQQQIDLIILTLTLRGNIL